MRAAVLRYRVMAYVTGVILIILCFVGVPLQIAGHADIVGDLHGFLYLVFRYAEAHITNQRTMEVLRDLGVAADIERYATPWDSMGDTLFTTSLAGPEVARIRAWGTGEERIADYLRTSPCTPLDVAQPDMESVLVRHATTRGARLRFATRYLSHQQDDVGVSVQLEDRLTGRAFTVRCRYLVGADGARSKIADDLGLDVRGTMARAATIYVLFEADLRRYAEHRRSVLYWILSDTTSHGEIGMGLLRAVRPWTRWIAGWGYDMTAEEPDLSDETATERIRSLIGDAEPEIRIEHKSTWFVNEAYARTYSRGRVFCGGDAVHRHPPSNGLGSNTGIQDAYNLAWKLAFVLKGWAGAGLLESYSHERAPIGRQVVDRANQSRLDFASLHACLRGTGRKSSVADAVARLRDPGPKGVAMRAGLERAVELKNYEFNALGVETNQRYESSAVLADTDGTKEAWPRDPQLHPQPTTRPGAKIPHAWLVDARGKKVSPLDITGRGKMTLVTGLSGSVWVDAVEKLAMPCLTAVVNGGSDAKDLYFSWHRAREIGESGAILVRPRRLCRLAVRCVRRQRRGRPQTSRTGHRKPPRSWWPRDRLRPRKLTRGPGGPDSAAPARDRAQERGLTGAAISHHAHSRARPALRPSSATDAVAECLPGLQGGAGLTATIFN